MQAFATQHPGLFPAGIAVLFIILWFASGFLVGLASGWQSLAERYRTEREFPAHRRRMQSAQLRAGMGYNNVLTLGSDAEGLYLGVLALFRIGHPRLLVPWADVVVEEPRRYLFVMMRTLRLGPGAIPLRVREPLAEFLLAGKTASGVAVQDRGMKWGI